MPLDQAASPHRRIGGPAAWRGPEIARQGGWEHRLSAAEIEDLAAALAAAKTVAKPTTALTAADFPLPVFGETLASLRRELRDGRGFALIRGLPIDRFSEIERETIFFGLGAHLGRAVSQNAHGELLGYVFDQGRTHAMANTRGYQTKADLTFHTDRCDLVGLLCHRAAKAGGESSVVSTIAIHDEILRTRPDLLPLLYRGFHYGEREAADSATGVSAARIPVYSEAEGVVSCRFISRAIELAWKRGVVAGPEEVEAVELVKYYTEHPDFRLDMVLEAGDMQFCNNYVTAHARTAFEDFPEPERRRLMVRLWLSFHDPRPLAVNFGEHEGIPFNPAAGPAPEPPLRRG